MDLVVCKREPGRTDGKKKKKTIGVHLERTTVHAGEGASWVFVVPSVHDVVNVYALIHRGSRRRASLNGTAAKLQRWLCSNGVPGCSVCTEVSKRSITRTNRLPSSIPRLASHFRCRIWCRSRCLEPPEWTVSACVRARVHAGCRCRFRCGNKREQFYNDETTTHTKRTYVRVVGVAVQTATGGVVPGCAMSAYRNNIFPDSPLLSRPRCRPQTTAAPL